MWCAARASCATAYLLTGAQHTLRAGIVRDDRELFHQIIAILNLALTPPPPPELPIIRIVFRQNKFLKRFLF